MTVERNFDEFVFPSAWVSKHGIGGFDPAAPVVLATTFDDVQRPLAETPGVSSITAGTAAKTSTDVLKLGLRETVIT